MDVIKKHLGKIEKPYFKLMEKGSVKFLKMLIHDSFGKRLISDYFRVDAYKRTIASMKEEEKTAWLGLVQKYGLRQFM